MRGHAVRRLAAWLLSGAALAAVFAAYLQPELAFSLANQLWNCF
jgi:hypothetical protein